ncbi:hypothetical protein TRVL_06586 [Trypanosoma vivax]|nr:hypothetical protein TRVL_06586 [Trypanosoma vivax]
MRASLRVVDEVGFQKGDRGPHRTGSTHSHMELVCGSKNADNSKESVWRPDVQLEKKRSRHQAGRKMSNCGMQEQRKTGTVNVGWGAATTGPASWNGWCEAGKKGVDGAVGW